MTAVMDDARSLVRTLMRGDRATWRAGDDGKQATHAAALLHELTDQQALELLAYAYGFGKALQPEAKLEVSHLCDAHAAVVLAGFSDGQQVDRRSAFPAEPITL